MTRNEEILLDNVGLQPYEFPQEGVLKAMDISNKEVCINLLNWLVHNNDAHVALQLEPFKTTNRPEIIYEKYIQSINQK